MVLKTPERARRRADVSASTFGDALGFVELVRDAARGELRVERLGGARRGLEHALLPIYVRALGAKLLLRDRVCVNQPVRSLAAMARRSWSPVELMRHRRDSSLTL